MRSLLIAVLVFAVVTNSRAQEFEWLHSNINVANKHIVPKYQALALASDALLESVSSLCDGMAQAVEVSEDVVRDYKTLYLAWAQVQHIQFGPVSFLKRYERFHYWPDKHNLGSRQLQGLLNSIEDGSVELETLEIGKKSVTLQGLSALERLFFSKDKRLNQNQCSLSIKIAKNLHQIALDVDQSWRLAPVEFAKEFELAGREQGTYGSSLEVTTIMSNALVTQLLLISEYKLGSALPRQEGGRVYQRELEAWLSQLSIDIIEQSLASLSELYTTGFSARTQALNPSLDKKIQQQFSRVIALSREFDKPLIVAIVDDEERPQIENLQREVMALEALIRSEMFAELEFATRFNSLDGD